MSQPIDEYIRVLDDITNSFICYCSDYGLSVGKYPKVIAAQQMLKKLKKLKSENAQIPLFEASK